MSPAGDPAPGDRVGPYTLEALVGAGGLATVWRARGPEGVVALKLLLRDRVTREEVERLRREYETLRRVDHPNVVQVSDLGIDRGQPWLAMEFVDGADLQQLLEQWEAHPPPDRGALAAGILRDVCEALEAVHSLGVVHRDIKPSNILIDRKGRARLTDFGGVKDEDAFETGLTVAGQLVGTVAYMAPEQITGDPVDARTDLYALGAVLYAVLTGRRPVEAETIPEFLARHLTETPISPAQLSPGLPPALCRVCERLLRKDPDQRLRSARQVLEAARARDERPPVRGRGSALAALDAALAELARGAGSALALEGPMGSGKSLLLEEFAARAEQTGVPIHTLTPQTAGLPEAGGLWLADELDRAKPAQIRALAERAARPGAPAVLLAWAADPAIAQRDVAAALHTLRAISESLPLPPLEEEDVVGWLRDRGLKPALAAALGRRVHAATGGVPGAVRAQTRAMVEAGWLARGPSGLSPAMAPRRLRELPLPLPSRQREAVLKQLRRLPPEDREAMDRLAVLGEETTSDLLEMIAPGSASLSAPGLVERRAEGLHQVLAFTSPSLREFLYARLAPERRLELHREIGRGLVARHRRRASAAGLAGRHLLAGGEPGEAWPLLAEAARRAARRGRGEEAIALADKALAARSEAEAALGEAARPLAAALLAIRGRARLEAGASGAGADLEEALALGGGPEAPGEEVAALAADAAQAALAGGDAARALALATAAMGSLSGEDRIAAMVTRAEALSEAGEAGDPETLATWEKTLSHARLEAPRLVGRCLLGRGAARRAGDPAAATADLEAAEALLRGTDERPLARCLLEWGLAERARGDHKKALDRAEEAETLARERGDLPLCARSGALRARSLGALGHSEEAREAAAAAEAIARALGRPGLVSG